MKYEEYVTETNKLIVAGELINSLQKGENDKTWLLHTMLFKSFNLSDNRVGDLLCLSIELQKYIAAIQLSEYNTLASEEEIVKSLTKSIEHFNGEEDLAKLKEQADNSVQYQKLIADKEANIKALEVLKERYLGISKSL